MFLNSVRIFYTNHDWTNFSQAANITLFTDQWMLFLQSSTGITFWCKHYLSCVPCSFSELSLIWINLRALPNSQLEPLRHKCFRTTVSSVEGTLFSQFFYSFHLNCNSIRITFLPWPLFLKLNKRSLLNASTSSLWAAFKLLISASEISKCCRATVSSEEGLNSGASLASSLSLISDEIYNSFDGSTNDTWAAWYEIKASENDMLS